MLTWLLQHKLDMVLCSLSGSGIFLSIGKGGRWTKWGCVTVLIAQPFWFYSGAVHGLYAVCVMSSVYGYSYARGLWRERGRHGRRA